MFVSSSVEFYSPITHQWYSDQGPRLLAPPISAKIEKKCQNLFSLYFDVLQVEIRRVSRRVGLGFFFKNN